MWDTDDFLAWDQEDLWDDPESFDQWVRVDSMDVLPFEYVRVSYKGVEFSLPGKAVMDIDVRPLNGGIAIFVNAAYFEKLYKRRLSELKSIDDLPTYED